MSDQRPQRVRVTGPPRYATGPRNRVGDVHEQTPLGDVFLRSLLKEQLALAIRVLLLISVTLGLLPLVFHLWPRIAEADWPGSRSPGWRWAGWSTRSCWWSGGATCAAWSATNATSPTSSKARDA